MLNFMDNSDTEAKIIKAAEHEFLTKGLAGARTTSIAQAAGVTHAMLHYYFRTKENLFERIATEKFSLLQELLIVPFDDFELTLNEVIRHIISRHIDFLKENQNLPRFILTEVLGEPERARILMSTIRGRAGEVIRLLQTKINDAADKGICRHVDAGMLMLDIVSLNVFSFVAYPLVNALIGTDGEKMDEFMERRKDENYITIISKLKP